MGLETGSTISSFITSNPTSSDPVNQGDDHLRLIKSVLQAQFPGAAGNGFATAITATEAEINALHGLTNFYFPAGTTTNFFQAAAPTGWVQRTDLNDFMLYIVSGAGGGSGGVQSPLTMNVVPYHTHGFSTGGVSADHTHGIVDPGHAHTDNGASTTYGGPGGTTNYQNFNGSHATATALTGIYTVGMNVNHTHSGGTDGGSSQTNWSPRYLANIMCYKS